MPKLAVALLLCVVTAIAGYAQSPTDATTPQACVDAIKQEQSRQLSAAAGGGHPADAAALHTLAATSASACADRLDVSTLDPSQLAPLANLYLMAGKTMFARRTLDRAVSMPGLSDSARAAAFLTGIHEFLRSETPAQGVPAAEQYVAQLDAIPGVIPQRLMGHRILESFYSDYDFDDKLAQTARTTLSLVRQLPPAQQRVFTNDVVTAYRDLASLQANELRPDDALRILRQAPSAFPVLVDSLGTALKEDIARYALVGHTAPSLHADYWINHDANAPAPSMSGAVSIVTFTANWCHSCRDSYPTLTQLSNEWGARGVHVVLAVELDGQFEGQAMSPEQEVAANRAYYVGHHNFPYPIALQRSAHPQTTDGQLPGATPNTEAYYLRSLPQFIVIDRTGRVQAVLMGWDPYGRRQHALTTIVGKLLGGAQAGTPATLPAAHT